MPQWAELWSHTVVVVCVCVCVCVCNFVALISQQVLKVSTEIAKQAQRDTCILLLLITLDFLSTIVILEL